MPSRKEIVIGIGCALLLSFIVWINIRTPDNSPSPSPGVAPGATPGPTPGATPGPTPGVAPGATPGATSGPTPGVAPSPSPSPALPECNLGWYDDQSGSGSTHRPSGGCECPEGRVKTSWTAIFPDNEPGVFTNTWRCESTSGATPPAPGVAPTPSPVWTDEWDDAGARLAAAVGGPRPPCIGPRKTSELGCGGAPGVPPDPESCNGYTTYGAPSGQGYQCVWVSAEEKLKDAIRPSLQNDSCEQYREGSVVMGTWIRNVHSRLIRDRECTITGQDARDAALEAAFPPV